jgi:antitoxin (DNA-binding transcriptional repressor) of toxin-antitoxin stability system
MQQFNIHEAKTRLSSLIDGAIKGNSFIIAKAGKPMVKVIPCSLQEPKKQRIGFLKGKISVPTNFNSIGKKEIEKLFRGTL